MSRINRLNGILDQVDNVLKEHSEELHPTNKEVLLRIKDWVKSQITAEVIRETNGYNKGGAQRH